ncbi:MAG: polysaccharide pyruvyl transferase family protein [Armatimonadetes bacterium]|nr:polysaccharide pyruvyl transferase family protein [Armatimonadota bacterium]
MSRAYIVGYFGMRNAGDDALLAVSAWGAKNYFGLDDIYISSSEVPATYNTEVCALFPRPRFRGHARIANPLYEQLFLRKHAQIIYGGGSRFQHLKQIERQYHILEMAGQDKHCAVGVSIGPFRDLDSQKACARFLDKLAFVGVRDQASYIRAREIAPDANIVLTFDNAVLLPVSAGLSLAGSDNKRRGIGVSICNYERFVGGDLKTEQGRIVKLADALRLCASSGDLDEVVLLDFNSHPHYGDFDVHLELKKLLGDVIRCEHVPYESDSAALMQRIAGLRGILAMRLHASVFAYCTSTPSVMLAYHDKCREWAKMIGLPTQSVFDAYSLDAEELAEGIRSMIGGNFEPELDLAEAGRRSMLNWEWLIQ